VDSTLSVVGGDVVHNHNLHYHSERPRDVWAMLQLVPNFRNVYHDMLSKATLGTGMWLLRGDRFQLWLEPNGDIKIFWGSGIRKASFAMTVGPHLMCHHSWCWEDPTRVGDITAQQNGP
jgi:hypothetical protein